ncbi:hypothetical protein FRC10_001283 [Ceratobasidium sp. 414]|nr:hypothetical protein FRC10_001283 [Ceratobasidium sp. 414]
MQGPEVQQWKEAVNSEYMSWEEKDVYEVVPYPQDEEIIPTILLLSCKTNKTGAEVRKKSQSSEDGPTLMSPVASAMDVKTTFLHAPLSRPVYLIIPSGFPNLKLLPGIPHAGQAL